MRAASLFVVFALMKVGVLWGHPLPRSPWTPIAYLWQDAAVVLGFALFERVVRREWPSRLVYAALVALAAITVPVGRVLSSPLTASMLRAARGTLADSIRYHATADNLLWAGGVLGAGIALPFLLRPRLAPGRISAAAALVVVLLGPMAASRVETTGLERNPLVALVRTSVPRVAPAARDADWRGSPFSSAGGQDLSALRGAASGRNALLVVLESTAARYLRAYGAAEDPTPYLTALAARSIVFESTYAVYPESVKGLVALLSSRYPGFDVPAARHAAIVRPSLATRLADAGYETALFHSGRFMYLGMDTLLAAAGFSTLEDAGDIGGNRESSFGVDEPAAVARILAWIDGRTRDRPFFAVYLPIAGHHPYATERAGPFGEDREIDRYRNALHEADRALGALVDGLRARGLDRSTLVVALADHGEAFGQHAGNYGHTLALYDENVRVPLLFYMDGTAITAPVARPASLIDVAPTILDLLAIDPPREFQGASLLPDRARMALFFTDYSLGLLGLRDGCLKYIYEMESERSKMFDVCRDPDERVDLAGEHRERAEVYRERLEQWIAAEVARIR